jgi:hypothetical protein
VAARPPELIAYRLSVYAAYGLVCALLFGLLFRSIFGDLYPGGTPSLPEAAPASPASCPEDVDRLYGQLAARAVQPAARGLDHGLLATEWDQWIRRWETQVSSVSARCGLDHAQGGSASELARALDSLEDLRRELSRCGEQSAEEVARIRDALAAARAHLHGR